MIAANIMSTDFIKLSPDESLAPALEALSAEGSGALLAVVDASNVAIGVISQRSIMRQARAKTLPEVISAITALPLKKAEEAMVADFASLPPSAPIEEVLALFTRKQNPAEAVLVVDDAGRLLGIITPNGIIKRLCRYHRKNQ
ncbi:CBS domain-containing protein [bacterium]|nr:MAG: CBS domain-containing protein [bacterium]